ncbi:hypothetical protein DFS34DRAFT_673163 [Phlyctochytrium arcticum]|nr:hypothetical protein DFS34DRAFT_673163 [Phlyctochytrium arcticum]
MNPISRPSLWSSAETADPSLQEPPPVQYRYGYGQLNRRPEVDIIQLLRHDLDSCAEFALTHCIGERRVDSECGLQLTIEDVQGEHEPIYDEYFDFFLERCTKIDGLWNVIHSVEIGEKLIRKTTVTAGVLAIATENPQIFRILLSHLPDQVPAYENRGDWYLPALRNAAQFGHIETLEVLLAREDVNVNAMSPDDDVAYILAASFLTRATAVADLLLSKGASVSNPSVLYNAVAWGIPLEYIENTLIEKHGARPLDDHAVIALKKRRFDVLAMLLRNLKTASPPFTQEV